MHKQSWIAAIYSILVTIYLANYEKVFGSNRLPIWIIYCGAAAAAVNQGRSAEAEKFLSLALTEAEKFGPHDTRVASSLKSLGDFYEDQGKYAQAEPLLERALRIRDALGTNDENVAQSLNAIRAQHG
jgi:tetratricopeptide (TPR) repeat protein